MNVSHALRIVMKVFTLIHNKIDMKKQYVIARYWRGAYVETMCEPTTQKDADKRCAKLQEKEDPLNEYRVLKIATKNKKVTYI